MLPPIFTRSRGLGKLYGQMFVPVLEQWMLTQLEADILLFLANNPAYDTARDIVERRYIAKSHVSMGVESLARRGLLQRGPLWRRAGPCRPATGRPCWPALRTGSGRR